MLAAPAPYLAVMDGDLQHDEKLLPKMLTLLQENDLDVVIGSRYMEGASIGVWEHSRVRMSRIAAFLGRIILKAQLSDPMSGFFMVKRCFFEKTVHHMTGKGFKVLLDLFASSPRRVRFKEVPYRFRQRQAGASKLDTMAVAEYFVLLADKTIGRFIPLRFLMFVAMGSIGALAHLTVLGLFYLFWGHTFFISQTSATLIAMTVNFILNNLFTFRDRRLHGVHFLIGLFTFYLACGVGVFLNLRIATFLFERQVPWWLAGLLGATVGGVWNYSITSTFTWTERPRPEKS
jgi:dolichol-phosphate mannosyltransferase